MMKRIIREFKRIDILINNAGIQKETPFISITEEEWDNIIGTNLKGAFLCSQFAAKEMIKLSCRLVQPQPVVQLCHGQLVLIGEQDTTCDF